MPWLALKVKVPRLENEAHEKFVDLDELQSCPNKLVEEVYRILTFALPADQSLSSLTYMDDDGDACTLVECTAVDAISLAGTRRSSQLDGVFELEVCANTEARCVSPPRLHQTDVATYDEEWPVDSASESCVQVTGSEDEKAHGDETAQLQRQVDEMDIEMEEDETLHVRMEIGEPQRVCFFDVSLSAVQENPCLLINGVTEVARKWLPAAASFRATYVDEEGDDCTLVASSVTDALEHRRPSEDGSTEASPSSVLTLQLRATAAPHPPSPHKLQQDAVFLAGDAVAGGQLSASAASTSSYIHQVGDGGTLVGSSVNDVLKLRLPCEGGNTEASPSNVLTLRLRGTAAPRPPSPHKLRQRVGDAVAGGQPSASAASASSGIQQMDADADTLATPPPGQDEQQRRHQLQAQPVQQTPAPPSLPRSIVATFRKFHCMGAGEGKQKRCQEEPRQASCAAEQAAEPELLAEEGARRSKQGLVDSAAAQAQSATKESCAGCVAAEDRHMEEVSRLKRTANKYMQEAADEARQVKKLRLQAEELSGQVHEMMQEKEMLASKAEDARKHAARVEQERAAVLAELQELKAAKQRLETENAEMAEQKSQALGQCTKLQETTAQYRSELMDSHGICQELKATKERLEKDAVEMAEQKSQTLGEYTKLQETTTHFRQELMESQAMCQALTGAMSKANHVKEEALGRAAALERTVEELRATKVWRPQTSAWILDSAPLVTGIEATEEGSARGDASKEFAEALERHGARQAFRIGRVRLTCSDSKRLVPTCAKVTVCNDGKEQWPETAVVALAAGEALDLPLVPLGPLRPKEAAEIVMDLSLPHLAEQGSASSVWAIRDASTGQPLGPLLVFETQWTASSD